MSDNASGSDGVVPRRAAEADLVAVAQHLSADDLPAPTWDPEALMISQGKRQLLKPLEPRYQALWERWIQRWSLNRAANTTNAYGVSLHRYLAYCDDQGRPWDHLLSVRDFLYGLAWPRMRYLQAVRTRRRKPLPPRQEPGMSWNTLALNLAAVTKAWVSEGLEQPSSYSAWRSWLEGIKRHLSAPVDQKSALLSTDVQQALTILDARPEELLAKHRDRALLLLGWHGALRVSELADLEVSDIGQGPTGWLMQVRSSKTDQYHQGSAKPLWPSDDPTSCPIRAYERWLSASGLHEGPLFRGITKHNTLRRKALSPDNIRRILGQYVAVRNWGAHSLRIGYVSQARLAGAATEEIMVVTQHRTRSMVDHYAQQIDAHRQGPGPLT